MRDLGSRHNFLLLEAGVRDYKILYRAAYSEIDLNDHVGRIPGLVRGLASLNGRVFCSSNQIQPMHACGIPEYHGWRAINSP